MDQQYRSMESEKKQKCDTIIILPTISRGRHRNGIGMRRCHHVLNEAAGRSILGRFLVPKRAPSNEGEQTRVTTFICAPLYTFTLHSAC